VTSERVLDDPEPLAIPPEPVPEPVAEAEAAPLPSPRALELARLTPRQAAFELAWPGIVEQLFRASGGTVTFAIVGQLGAVATAAMGASFQYLFLLFPIWGALSTGTVAVVARRMGQGRPDAAADALRQSLVLATALAVPSGVAFVILAEPLLRLIGAADDVVTAGAPFLALLGGLNILQTIGIIGVNGMRAAGDSRTPMWLSLIGSIAYVVLGLALVRGLGLGLMGAGYAQLVLNALFLAITLALLWRGRAGLRLAGGTWAIQRDTLRSLMSVSLPSMAETLLFSVGILALGGVVFRFGTEAYAAHQIISSIEALSFLPCVGFSAAAAALVGQSLGMRDPTRAKAVGWAATRMAALWTSTAGVAFALLPAFFIGLFTSSPDVVIAGVGAMVVVGIAQPAQAIIFTIGGALRGAGDTRYTLALTILNWFVVRFPLAVFLGIVLGWGLTGVWLAVAIDYAVRATLMARRFAGGAWAKRRV
jgi:putative MATE family efflux protein